MFFSKLRFIVLPIAVASLIFSCGAKKDNNQVSNGPAIDHKEASIDAGRQFLAYESEKINEYIRRSGKDFLSTGTGLRYIIYEKGEGEAIEENDFVEIKYYVNLLDGTKCYDTDSLGTLKFKLGYKDVPAGISEAMLLMRKGSRAELIVPSHLAFGLTGDQNKIPGNSTLIYNLQVLDLQKE